MGGLAARLAGECYLGISINRERHAADREARSAVSKGR
jgi:hypothetical protein